MYICQLFLNKTKKRVLLKDNIIRQHIVCCHTVKAQSPGTYVHFTKGKNGKGIFQSLTFVFRKFELWTILSIATGWSGRSLCQRPHCHAFLWLVICPACQGEETTSRNSILSTAQEFLTISSFLYSWKGLFPLLMWLYCCSSPFALSPAEKKKNNNNTELTKRLFILTLFSALMRTELWNV